VTTNTAASVRARLTNHAKASHRPFQEVLQHYGLERLLYRLAQSPHRGGFLLKGALLLNAWNAPVSRPTRDIDLLGYAENDVAVMETMCREVCDVVVVDDGLRFDATTLVGRRIKQDADYQGVRLTFVAFLEKARIPMQVDIGFGDVVTPEAEERDYPTLLDLFHAEPAHVSARDGHRRKVRSDGGPGDPEHATCATSSAVCPTGPSTACSSSPRSTGP